jgi:hypothetical protein
MAIARADLKGLQFGLSTLRVTIHLRRRRAVTAKIDISSVRSDNDNQPSIQMQCVSKWLMEKEYRAAV